MNRNILTSKYLIVDHLKFARLWLWLGVAMVCSIVLLSLVNVPSAAKSILLHDKLMHCIAYGGLMGWFAQIFRHSATRLVLAGIFVGLGVGVEYLQSIVPHRQFELLDMLANTSGVVLAWALVHTRMGYILDWFESRFLIAEINPGPNYVPSHGPNYGPSLGPNHGPNQGQGLA